MPTLSAVGDITDLADAINRGGTIAVLVAVVVALTWVARWLLTRLLEAQDAALVNATEERNAWRAIALANARTASSTVNVAEQQVGLR